MSDPQRLRERFWEFFEQNSPQLLRFAGSHATPDYPAEDLLQDAFLCAWDRLDSARCDNWSAWLRCIIVCRRIDGSRRRRSSPVVLAGDITKGENADLIDSVAGETLSPSELAEHPDDAQLVQQALTRMKNAQQRRVLELLYFDAGNYPSLNEVAAAMNISHASAKKLHQRAKNALKQSLRQLAKEMNIPTERQNHEP